MSKHTIVEKDGQSFRCEEVRHEGQVVGLAPTLDFTGSFSEILEEMVQVFDDEQVVKWALRQMREEAKNKVRAKCNRDKVPDSVLLKASYNGEVDMKEIVKLPEKDRRKAIIKQLGLGKEAKPDATEVHWDIM